MASGGAAPAGAGSASKIGTWIKEKYRLDSVLGDGGMAVVYAATHRNKKRFAVKMLRVELSNVEDIRTRFLREGYVANTVDHPGVVAVIDDDVAEDGCAFLVMELLEGASLEDLALKTTDGKLPVATILAAMHQVLDVLAAAHAKNVVHRDLKPANLFVTKSGQAKVLDFGIARIREANLTNATQTGHAMGTPAFMAPEQARGKASLIGPKTDVYSIGATMFSLLSGIDVHQGETAQEVMFEAGSKPARSLATVWPQAHPSLVALVDRALAFDPKDRFDDANAMREATARVFKDMMGEPIPPNALVGAGSMRVRIAASIPDLDAAGSDEAARTMAAPVSTAKTQDPVQTLAAASAVPSAVGHTTEQPVSSVARPSTTTQSPRGRLQLYVVAAIATFGVAALVLVSLQSKPPTPPLPPPAVADSIAPSATTTATAEPSAIPSGITSATASADTIAPLPSASAAPSARPSASARPHSTTSPTAKPSATHGHSSSDFDRR